MDGNIWYLVLHAKYCHTEFANNSYSI